MPIIPPKCFRKLNDLSDVITRMGEEAMKRFMNKKFLATDGHCSFQIKVRQRFQLSK